MLGWYANGCKSYVGSYLVGKGWGGEINGTCRLLKTSMKGPGEDELKGISGADTEHLVDE